MFNNKVIVTIMTRTENKDNLNVMKVVDRVSELNSIFVNCDSKSKNVKIKFVTRKSNVKRLEEDLELLRLGQIKAEMEIA